MLTFAKDLKLGNRKHYFMALVFDIKRFAVNDGPGIRTTIFMKGCPLRCVWCHNPEGLEDKPVKLYTKKKCIGCQSCVDVCPQQNLTLTPDGIKDNGNCILCGKCTDECPTLALQMAGKEWDKDELMTIVEKERQVMEESEGGVTICGGEPLMHPDYLIELLTELKSRGFHTTVDTTLFASRETIEKVMPITDLFLVDLKHTDSERHKYFTKVPNEKIIENIRFISERGARFWIRIPLIVGVNADEENLTRSAEFLAGLPTPPEVVNILPYHDIGKGKHERMGTEYNPDDVQMSEPDELLQRHALEIFTSKNINAKIGG